MRCSRRLRRWIRPWRSSRIVANIEAFLTKQSMDRAISLYKESITADGGTRWEAHYFLGKVLTVKAGMLEAAEALKAAVKLQPDNAAVLNEYASPCSHDAASRRAWQGRPAARGRSALSGARKECARPRVGERDVLRELLLRRGGRPLRRRSSQWITHNGSRSVE